MKQTLGIVLLILFILMACGESQRSIQDYELYKVKFIKSTFNSNNGEFSISLPKGWLLNEDPVDSDTVLYKLETGSMDSSFVAMSIMKMNVIYGSIDDELDHLIQEMTTRASNVTLIETSKIIIGERKAKTSHLTFEHNGQVIQEEIGIFIPINKNQYYYIGLISDKNENIENNFGMMIECAKTFKLLK